ncbi:hypothetical protein L1987_26119 [Smallanthus sonchifolius]|uniref:Uncharacterized protein n=1 Tax=Smallanthus sonchifolius TaxID=185202 RepID=A0ACB9I8W4_9ASTR|nr:hypothetical protein L1987_26119 [Smallanthus sonchifolius]
MTLYVKSPFTVFILLIPHDRLLMSSQRNRDLDLQPPKHITASLNQVLMIPETSTSFFHLSTFFQTSIIWIKLPYLLPKKIVGAIQLLFQFSLCSSPGF